MKYYRQKDARHCGPTVVSMALSKFSYNITQEQIADTIMKVDATGIKNSYMYHIAGYITDLGFWPMYSSNLSDNDAWNILVNAIKEGIPVIVLQRYSETDPSGHYRVILGIDEVGKKKMFILTYHDPANDSNIGGSYKQLKKEDFMELWKKKNSTALEFNNALLIIRNKKIEVSNEGCSYCKSDDIEIGSVNYNNPAGSRFINENTKISAKGMIIHCRSCNGNLVYFEP